MAAVGNEAGMHPVGAQLYQAFDDVGFAPAADAMTCRVGRMRSGKEHRELRELPQSVRDGARMMARSTLYPARLLPPAGFPPQDGRGSRRRV